MACFFGNYFCYSNQHYATNAVDLSWLCDKQAGIVYLSRFLIHMPSSLFPLFSFSVWYCWKLQWIGTECYCIPLNRWGGQKPNFSRILASMKIGGRWWMADDLIQDLQNRYTSSTDNNHHHITIFTRNLNYNDWKNVANKLQLVWSIW